MSRSAVPPQHSGNNGSGRPAPKPLLQRGPLRSVRAAGAAAVEEPGTASSSGSQQQGQQQAQAALAHEPLSSLDVDAELWEVLDMCSDDELETLYNVLHCSSPFSPVLKSLVSEKEPALLQVRGRRSVQHKVESHFRFLAADSATLLKGRRPNYRQTLLNIRDK